MNPLKYIALSLIGFAFALTGRAQNQSQIAVYNGGFWTTYVNTTSNSTLLAYNASSASGRVFLTKSLTGIEYFKRHVNISFVGAPVSGPVYTPCGVSSGGIQTSSPVYQTLNAMGLNVNSYLYYNAGTESNLSIDYQAAIYKKAGTGTKLAIFVYNRNSGTTVNGSRYFKLEDIYTN